MIDVVAASRAIQEEKRDFGQESIPLTQAMGRVLRESVHADRDFPPFDRVMMDGIAFAFDDFEKGGRVFKVQATQLAGSPPLSLGGPQTCIEVMTGAMCPQGADVVLPYEEIEFEAGEGGKYARIKTEESNFRKGQHIHNQGFDQKKGALLLQRPRRISPSEIAVLATVGCTEVRVARLPKVAIISTGDELVPVSAQPLPYQIRSSNAPMLQAALQNWRIQADCYHLLDELEGIKQSLAQLLESHDIILLSGGVSRGKADYVPLAMEQLGVRKIFHRVKQRPGKPFWFGSAPQGSVCFGLPGNPVSSFITYLRYVEPWLSHCLGLEPVPVYARLAEAVSFKPALTYFLPVKTKVSQQGICLAYPLPGHGSGDLANQLQTDAFLELPADQTDFKAGAVFPLIPYRR